MQEPKPENHHSAKPEAARWLSGKRLLYIKHSLLLVIVVSLFGTLVWFNSGYEYVFKKFCQDIWTIGQYDSLTTDQRREVKLGFTAKYLRMLRTQTPTHAVILMPPDSVLFPKDTTSAFNPLVRNRRWVTYFIYPRKLVYPEERDTLALYKHYTHVAVVDYWGYQYAAPVVGVQKRYTVLTR